MAERIRRGDTVAVMSGDDRGKRGRVLRLIHENGKVVVEGVNLVYKHLRKSQQNPQGGRIRKEAPIHASKVMPIDPETNRPTRVGMVFEDGKKRRIGRRSGKPLDAAGSKAQTGKAQGSKSPGGKSPEGTAGGSKKPGGRAPKKAAPSEGGDE